MSTGATRPAGVRRVLVAHGLSAVAIGLPWPALLVAVWDEGHSGVGLGITGAARMAPYVLLSWLAGRMADRISRGRVVRASLALRLIALVATALLLGAGQITAAVVCACVTVGLGTPAYPAIAAEMPALAGVSNEEATSLLVTLEAGAFVVGPALGGLLLGLGGPSNGCWLAAGLTATALTLVRGVIWVPRVRPAATGPDARPGPPPVLSTLRRRPAAVVAMTGVAVINAIDSAVAISLLPLAEKAWHGDKAQFGVATAAVGLGALAAPLLQRFWGLGMDAWRRSSLALALPLVVVAAVSGLWWAVVPLTLMGTASVHLEAVATTVIQRAVPDDVRSSVLGLTDSVMVAAAAGSALLTPLAVGVVGPRAMVAACAAAGLGLAAAATLRAAASASTLPGGVDVATAARLADR
jgi:Major Facilitator Superfamily